MEWPAHPSLEGGGGVSALTSNHGPPHVNILRLMYSTLIINFFNVEVVITL